MRTRNVAALVAVCFVIVMAVPAVGGSEASVSGDGVIPLDGNGVTVREAVSGVFGESMTDTPGKLDIDAVFTHPELFESTEDAKAYADRVVGAALEDIYLTDPLAIWLWDYPVSDIDVKAVVVTVVIDSAVTGFDQGYFMVSSVSFSLSVPEDMADNPSKYLGEVREKMGFKASGDDIPSKVRSIADHLRSIKSMDDEEGEVSNVHDALVTGKSSSAGVAAAFNALCIANDITSTAVSGTVYKAFDEDGTSEGYWNLVQMEGSWYGCDAAWFDGDDRSVLMAGSNTQLQSKAVGERFGPTHVPDQSVSMSSEGYDWPDDRNFFEKYGTHVMAIIIVGVIIGVFVYAIRKGNI